MTCPTCKGTGAITLLTTREPCAVCGGTGEISPGDPTPAEIEQLITQWQKSFGYSAAGARRRIAKIIAHAAALPDAMTPTPPRPCAAPCA